MSNRQSNLSNNESGFIMLAAIFVVTIVLLVIIILSSFFTIILGATKGLGSNGTMSGNQSNGAAGGGDNAAMPVAGDSQAQPAKYDDTDVNVGELVCINLPGVASPRTPALDRRVALLLTRVKQDLDSRGVPTLTFTWGFRTSCQQANVIPLNSTSKAEVGTSYHEAGAAVDVNGMTARPDRGLIVSVFRQHGWTWLGPKGDPPHFQVAPDIVGVRSKFEWIKASQRFFNNGGPQGCRGSQCGQ